MLPSLTRRHTIVVQFSHYCRRFLFFLGNSSLSLAPCLVVRQPCDAGTNTYPGFSARFTFIELALRRVPIFICRSRAGTFQIISARLSKNSGTMVTFASDTSLPLHTSTSWRVWLGWRGGSVLWCLRTIATIMPETALVSFRTLAIFLSTGNKYPFLLQRR